ncbi:MAG: putative glycosyltransferase [Acidobacteriaceae bacterium]|jgi:GT2 family glycosyltransferase|nr:putative glycosyltransferase [Acidobacteriaceae bacterium]
MTGRAPILMVVVLYRTSLAHSLLTDFKTIAGLKQAFTEDRALLDAFDLLLWDNSPQPSDSPALPFPFTYHHAARNVGVAAAYNGAVDLACEHGASWLLLLDHDTSVTAEYLSGMRKHAEEAESHRAIAAVAPLLTAGDVLLSPRLWRFARHVPLPRAAAPYTETRAIYAANSGTMLKVEALRAVGGYSTRFWLDYSDIELFHRLHRRGYQIRIANDLALEHEIAMLDYDARMSPARYANYLAAEGDFLDLCRGPVERAMHLLRLVVRTVRQRRFADATFSRMTRQELWRRLRTGRRQRQRGTD